jgi:hypothetical protein
VNPSRIAFICSCCILSVASARATVLYTTLVDGNGGTVPVENVSDVSNETWADEFLTGSSPLVLTDVIALLAKTSGTGTVTAYLYGNASGLPGTQLDTIASVSTSALPGTAGDVTFTGPTGAGAIQLAASTEYWIVLSGSQNAISDASWQISQVENGAGAVGVTGQNHAEFTGSGWTSFANNTFTDTIPELEVDASAIPEPATVAILGAGLAGLGVLLRRRGR